MEVVAAFGASYDGDFSREKHGDHGREKDGEDGVESVGQGGHDQRGGDGRARGSDVEGSSGGESKDGKVILEVAELGNGSTDGDARVHEREDESASVSGRDGDQNREEFEDSGGEELSRAIFLTSVRIVRKAFVWIEETVDLVFSPEERAGRGGADQPDQETAERCERKDVELGCHWFDDGDGLDPKPAEETADDTGEYSEAEAQSHVSFVGRGRLPNLRREGGSSESETTHDATGDASQDAGKEGFVKLETVAMNDLEGEDRSSDRISEEAREAGSHATQRRHSSIVVVTHFAHHGVGYARAHADDWSFGTQAAASGDSYRRDDRDSQRPKYAASDSTTSVVEMRDEPG